VAVWIFAASAAFIVYVLGGYPLLLAAAARRRGRAVASRFEPRTVSVLLPVRDGAPWIRAKLESILRLDYPRHLVEIFVISDGSEDGTDAIVREFAGAGVELVGVPRAGKAAALNAGMARARGDILFFTDVRQRLAADALRVLVACFADPRVGAASGELIIGAGTNAEHAQTGLYWRYEKWIRRRLSLLDSVPGATGCIYAMRRDLAVPLPPDILLDDVYLPLGAFFRGYRVVLAPAYAYDTPAALGHEFRRKVRTLAGVWQVMAHYPALLGPGNRMWIHFVSHKLGRLVLPWALAAAAVAACGLPPGWRVAALSAQAAFYGLAALDLVVPDGAAVKRLSSPARAFVVLMAAALCAVSIAFLPARVFWAAPAAPRARAAAVR